MDLTVVYAAYNEETNVRDTIERSLEALVGHFDPFEIVIVDDASTDATGRIADELAERHPQVRVLRNPRNLGQGGSLIRGFGAAQGEWVMHNAMDYPFDLKDLLRIKPLLANTDVVVVTRARHAGYSAYRYLVSRVNLMLINRLFGLKLRDYNFVQLYRRAVLEAVRVEARSAGFLTPETIIRAHDAGFRVRQIEVEYHPRMKGASVLGRPGVVLASLRDLLRFWFRRRRAMAKTPADRGTSSTPGSHFE